MKYSPEFINVARSRFDSRTASELDFIAFYVTKYCGYFFDKDDIFVIMRNVDDEFIHCLYSAVFYNERLKEELYSIFGVGKEVKE